jgi:hypothetical protein
MQASEGWSARGPDLAHSSRPAEIGFLSNAREQQLLKRPDHRQRLAEALFQGVSRYAQSLSPFQVAQRASAE